MVLFCWKGGGLRWAWQYWGEVPHLGSRMLRCLGLGSYAADYAHVIAALARRGNVAVWWEVACPLRSGVVKMRTFALRGSLAINGLAALEQAEGKSGSLLGPPIRQLSSRVPNAALYSKVPKERLRRPAATSMEKLESGWAGNVGQGRGFRGQWRRQACSIKRPSLNIMRSFRRSRQRQRWCFTPAGRFP